jgi:hypothetical protein
MSRQTEVTICVVNGALGTGSSSVALMRDSYGFPPTGVETPERSSKTTFAISPPAEDKT